MSSGGVGPELLKGSRMADKRATPEAPQDADADPRGTKRVAPTIDLTATELAAEAAAGAPPPGDADAPPEQPAASKTADTAKRGWSANIGGIVIAAGAGAACMVLVLFGLWLGGVLPLATTNSSASNAQEAALEKQIAALGQRVATLEATVVKLPAGDAGVGDKLAVADNAMKSLGVALSALSHRTDDTAANAAAARKAADAAEKAVADLHTAMKDAAVNAPGTVPRADIEALDKRIATLEMQARATREALSRNTGNDNAARLALSASVLRDAVALGAPYANELAAVKSLGGDDKALAPLAPFAATGVPDKMAMAHELTALTPAMLKLSGVKAPSGGFLAKLEANASRLVKVRPLSAPQGEDVSTLLARIEVDAANADIAAALADLEKLPADVRAPASAWIEKARARQAAIDAARRFAAAAARRLGQP